MSENVAKTEIAGYSRQFLVKLQDLLLGNTFNYPRFPNYLAIVNT